MRWRHDLVEGLGEAGVISEGVPNIPISNKSAAFSNECSGVSDGGPIAALGRFKPFDPSGSFVPTADSGELRRLAVRGAGVSVLGQGSVLAVQMIATVLLARLLTPGDFGLVIMVTTFSLLFVSFGVTGFADAILQRDTIDHLLVSNLFWINVGAGLLLAVGFAAAGSLAARFYGDPRVTRIAAALSLTIFFSSTSAQHLALLKRAMRFSAVSANDIIARIVSLALSTFLAWRGWGYWALVIGAVALPLVLSIGAWVFCRWIPGLPRRVAGTWSMVRFAISVYGRFSANYSARNLDNLLVGWRFGPHGLGVYKKAYDLFALSANQLLSPLYEVAVSALSRLKVDSDRYRQHFLAAVSILAFLGMGLGTVLTLVGRDLIFLLLGPKWETSGRIFTFFAPGIGAMLLYGAQNWIHVSIGRPDRWVRWSIIEFAVTGSLFLLALPWGPLGIAVAWSISFWILVIPAFWYAGRPIHLGVSAVIGAAWKYVLASLLAGCATARIIRAITSYVAILPSVPALARMLMVSSVFVTLYLGAVVLLHGGWGPLYRLAGVLRDMVPWNRFPRLFSLNLANLTLSRGDQMPAPISEK